MSGSKTMLLALQSLAVYTQKRDPLCGLSPIFRGQGAKEGCPGSGEGQDSASSPEVTYREVREGRMPEVPNLIHSS